MMELKDYSEYLKEGKTFQSNYKNLRVLDDNSLYKQLVECRFALSTSSESHKAYPLSMIYLTYEMKMKHLLSYEKYDVGFLLNKWENDLNDLLWKNCLSTYSLSRLSRHDELKRKCVKKSRFLLLNTDTYDYNISYSLSINTLTQGIVVTSKDHYHRMLLELFLYGEILSFEGCEYIDRGVYPHENKILTQFIIDYDIPKYIFPHHVIKNNIEKRFDICDIDEMIYCELAGDGELPF